MCRAAASCPTGPTAATDAARSAANAARIAAAVRGSMSIKMRDTSSSLRSARMPGRLLGSHLGTLPAAAPAPAAHPPALRQSSPSRAIRLPMRPGGLAPNPVRSAPRRSARCSSARPIGFHPQLNLPRLQPRLLALQHPPIFSSQPIHFHMRRHHGPRGHPPRQRIKPVPRPRHLEHDEHRSRRNDKGPLTPTD